MTIQEDLILYLVRVASSHEQQIANLTAQLEAANRRIVEIEALNATLNAATPTKLLKLGDETRNLTN